MLGGVGGLVEADIGLVYDRRLASRGDREERGARNKLFWCRSEWGFGLLGAVGIDVSVLDEFGRAEGDFREDCCISSLLCGGLRRACAWRGGR